jgi:hypothetical protein
MERSDTKQKTYEITNNKTKLHSVEYDGSFYFSE